MHVTLKRIDLADEILTPRARTRNNYTFINYDQCHVKVYQEFEKTYLSNLLTKNVLEGFKPQNGGTLIVSPTGTGKSTMVTKTMGPIAAQLGKRVLLVVPRAALAMQYKKQIAKIYDPKFLARFTDEGIKSEHHIANFDVYMMQELEQPFLQKEIQDRKDAYWFVVFDEVHLFVNDATFNPFTAMVFDFLFRIGRSANRIYLSATPKSALSTIIEAEKSLDPLYRKPMKLNWDGSEAEGNTWLTVYQMERDFSNINLHFFKSEDEIPSLIGQPSDSNKALIFVDKKAAGKSLTEAFNHSQPNTAIFIDAESKNTDKQEEYTSLIENSVFDAPILIATKFLEVGVNIADRAVKSIVICSLYKDEIEQMLGRKRLRSTETVNLFLRLPSSDELSYRLTTLKAEYQDITNRIKDMDKHWDNWVELPWPFFIQKRGGNYSLSWNRLSLTINKIYRNQLVQLLSDGTDHVSARYMKMVRSLLPGCKECFTPPKTSESLAEEIRELIDPILGKELNRDEYIQLGDKILNVLDRPRRSDQLENAPTKSLNKAFAELSFPYKATDCSREGKKSTWRIERG